MSGSPQLEHSLLERIDLSLAGRVAGAGSEPLAAAQELVDKIAGPSGRDSRWIGALLRLRGLLVQDEDVIEVLAGRPGRLPFGCQEHSLVRGLDQVLQVLRDRAGRGLLPDGGFLVELFRAMTRGVARFRNNALRRDQPWDAVLFVGYPAPGELQQLLDTFDLEHRYRDVPPLFDQLHPVRQSFRVLWRFARIAPFPDFNLPMAWVAMCSYLLARGYPMPAPAEGDQRLLHRLVGGPPPTRCVQFEARLLQLVEEL